MEYLYLNLTIAAFSILRTLDTFKRTSLDMAIILAGLVVTVLEQVFTNYWLKEHDKWYWAVLAGLCWFSMLQINIWLYIRRYNILNSKNSKYSIFIRAIPYVLLAVQIPDYLTLALS